MAVDDIDCPEVTGGDADVEVPPCEHCDSKLGKMDQCMADTNCHLDMCAQDSWPAFHFPSVVRSFVAAVAAAVVAAGAAAVHAASANTTTVMQSWQMLLQQFGARN